MARSVAARIGRGDVTGSSFWFAIDAPEDEEWTPAPTRDGLPLRTLKRLRLMDVGPVSYPAYEQTSAILSRSTDAARRDTVRLRIEIERAKAWHL